MPAATVFLLLVSPRWRRTLRLTLAVLTAGVLLVVPSAEAAGNPRQINMVPSGSKVSPRPEESTLKLKQDAEAGDVDAQLLLGMRYLENRRDVPPDRAWVGPDPAEAARWFRKAAEQGHPLGIMRTRAAYYQGQGVARDSVEVHKWGIIGAALAKNDRDREAFKTTTEVMAKDMSLTPEQRAEGEKRASDWLEAFKNRKKK